MKTLWAALSYTLRSLPTLAYAWVGAVAVAGLLWAWHGHSVTSAYAEGRQSALTEAANVAPVFVDRVVQAAGKTDTVIRRVTNDIHTVDTLIQLVPDSIRVAIPSVDTALRACTTLAQDCDALRVSLLVERTARDELTQGLTLLTVAKSDSIRSLSRRPRWRTVVTSSAVSASASLLLCLVFCR